MSHDRYFLDDVVDRILAFEGNGKLTQYEGGYTDYAEAKVIVGRRVLYNVDKIKKYLDAMAV